MDVSEPLSSRVSACTENNQIEVLFGLNEEYAVGAITDRLGDEGRITHSAGFDIYRAVVSAKRMETIIEENPDAIDFAEVGRRATSNGLQNENA